MIDLLKKLFVFNGFEQEELRSIRNDLVEITLESFKKLAMGIGILYILAMIVEADYRYTRIYAAYLSCFVVFMFLDKMYRNKKNNHIAELAIVSFLIGTLTVALYESVFLSSNNTGVFYPIFMILFAVMFTGNPFAIDIILFVMTAVYLIASYNVKSPELFRVDMFVVIFTYLISNMVNAMVARSRTKMILKTKEVEAERKKYHDVFETAPCGIIEYKVLGEKIHLVSINQQGLNLYGYTRDDIKNLDDNFIIDSFHPEDAYMAENRMNQMKALGDVLHYEYRLRRKDDSYIWVIGQCSVTNVDDTGITIISACINIDAEKKAIDANEAKSRFLSRMSHDIRTPMNVILGITDIVLDNPTLTDDVRNNMEDIKSSSNFLLGLINDILDVSKIEADEMVLHKEPYSRLELINYLNTMIRPLCEQKKINFSIDSNNCSFDYVLLDKVRFNQILFNLLSNAVKFTPEGGSVYVIINHLKKSKTKIREEIIIGDTGIGMSEGFQIKMFDPFSQESNEHINESQGTGLGLAIVKRIIDLMNGTIEVESHIGKGTVYNIKLDMELCEAPKIVELNKDYTSLKGCRILLCEDHPINQKIARTLLNKIGISCDIVGNGQEGIDKLEKAPDNYYDAILMDIRMPIMGGLEATRIIRKTDKNTPIIAMTANVFDTDRQQSIDAGMNAHISKPIEPAVLYNTLKMYIK